MVSDNVRFSRNSNYKLSHAKAVTSTTWTINNWTSPRRLINTPKRRIALCTGRLIIISSSSKNRS